MRTLSSARGSGLLIALCALFLPGAERDGARGELFNYLDGIATQDLTQRAHVVAEIQSREAAEKRKADVHAKILELIGGLPQHSGPIVTKQFGTVTGEGFRLEKIAYQSLPDFWVTADVYVPANGDGPFPAVVIAPGHSVTGKTGEWGWGVNFARNGIIALAYDPIGQGERLQYFDQKENKSRVGNPTGEHGEANLQALLIGDNIARYMVNDSMRALDYLSARKDVDSARLGAFGCSGGGTATAYFAAFDDRLKVAASACYITSFEALLASPTGNQDAEQSIPHFIQDGLDFPDWVEQFAPKPYAIISTTNDMFPFAGAEQTFREVKRIYGVYGADDRIQWITGPGGHGNLVPIGPQILKFFTRYLKNSDAEPSFTALRLENPQTVQCTPTGQVRTSLGGETVYSLNRKRADDLMPAHAVVSNQNELRALRGRLQAQISSLAGTTVRAGQNAPNVLVKATQARDGYQIQTVALESENHVQVSGLLAIPDRTGTKAAVVMMGSQTTEEMSAPGSELDRLAKAGDIVMLIEPQPTPPGTESIKSPYLGLFNLLSLRAFLVGKTIIGLRIDDTIRALNYLSTRKDVNQSGIAAYGEGAGGLVMLHAAVLDGRISRLAIEHSLASYRTIVEQPLHRNVSESVIPGVLRKYDTGDLLLAAHAKSITIVKPQDAVGAPVPDEEYRKELSYAFRSEEMLGQSRRIRIAAQSSDSFF